MYRVNSTLSENINKSDYVTFFLIKENPNAPQKYPLKLDYLIKSSLKKECHFNKEGNKKSLNNR